MASFSKLGSLKPFVGFAKGEFLLKEPFEIEDVSFFSARSA